MSESPTPNHLLPIPPPCPCGAGAPRRVRRRVPLGGLALGALFLALQYYLAGPGFEAGFGKGTIVYAMLCCGAVPALLLMLPTRAVGRADALLRGLALLGLYAVFVPFMLCCREWLSVAHAGIVTLFAWPFAHLAWLLFALPYVLRRLSRLWRRNPVPPSPEPC